MRPASRPSWLVVITASSGGLEALSSLVSGLTDELPAAFLIAQHTPPTSHRRLPRLLSDAGPLRASYAEEGQALEAGRIFVAPPDRHLVVRGERMYLSRGEREYGLRPSGNVLFRSAARAFGARSMGIVLSGSGCDGAAGLAELQAAGGLTLIQSPEDARLATMPLSALAMVEPDACAPASRLGTTLIRLLRERDPRANEGRQEGARVKAPRRRPRGQSLRGSRILVAEDEYLIASEVVGMLHEWGCDAVGPVADVEAGLRLLERERYRVDCAVLDVDLRGETVLPLAAALARRAVPSIFATGYGGSVLPEVWTGAPRLQKPYDTQALGAALRTALRLRWLPSTGAPLSASGIGYGQEVLKDSRNLLMRSRVLRDSFSARAIARSYEALKKTHECIDSSARRGRSARRTLRGWPLSDTRGGEDTDEEGS